MRFSVECAFLYLGKRRLTSRKTAFCPDGLTQKRILDSTPHAKAHSGGSEDPRVHLSVRTSCRMRFFVTRWLQNVLFRRVLFSSPGQTRRRLTEKRTLGHRLTERRILQPASWTKHPLHDLKLSKLRFTRQVLEIPFLSLHLCLLRGSSLPVLHLTSVCLV